MKKTLLVVALLAGIGLARPQPAAAHATFSFGFWLPGVSFFVPPPPPPVVYYPDPVYYAPAPVFVGGYSSGYGHRHFHGCGHAYYPARGHGYYAPRGHGRYAPHGRGRRWH